MTSIGEALYAEAQEGLREDINERAIEYGWAIFDCAGSENAPYQLCKDDDSDIFKDDAEAWEHVKKRADLYPVGVEADALAWLQRNAPDEHAQILEWCSDKAPA